MRKSHMRWHVHDEATHPASPVAAHASILCTYAVPTHVGLSTMGIATKMRCPQYSAPQAECGSSSRCYPHCASQGKQQWLCPAARSKHPSCLPGPLPHLHL